MHDLVKRERKELVDPEKLPPARENPLAVYLAGLKPTGRRSMAAKLKVVAHILGCEDPRAVPWEKLRFQEVVAIRTRLQEMGKAPATVNASLYAVRGVAKAAFRLGKMSAEDYERIRSVEAIRSSRLPSGRVITKKEIAKLLDGCSSNGRVQGARDAAIIGLLYSGLRRAEIVALNREDYNAETGELVVRGKGDKERLLYLNDGSTLALADWLSVRGPEPGPLFVPVNKGGAIQAGQRMNDQAIYMVLQRRGQKAGLDHLSPHDFRRTFVTDLLDAGADIAVVKRLAGHASVQTTERYDRRDEEAKKKAVRLLHLPYRGRDTDRELQSSVRSI
jgi:site-specific recombinase XerD